MENLKKLGSAIETYVHPTTYPIAIKMLTNEAEIPEGIERVQKMFGHQLITCQAWGMTRRNGTPMALLKDDIFCPTSIISLGLAEPPNFWTEGGFYLDWYTPTRQAAKTMATEMPRLPLGKYVGLVLAPLHTCNFEPDLVIIYGNSAQILRLICAAVSQTGSNFSTSIWAPGVCTYTIASTVLKGNCQFAIPCYGDRECEGTADDELIFTIPSSRFEEIASSLKFFFDHATPWSGHGRVTERLLHYTPVLPDTYVKVRAMM